MNKTMALRILYDCFSDFEVCEDMIFELLQYVAASGVEKRFFRDLIAKLQILRSLGVLATQHEEFEPIGSHLYSMHLNGKGFNIRILYAFLSNRTPVLLLAFFEREGKSRTDYAPHIEAAVSRLRKIKEEG